MNVFFDLSIGIEEHLANHNVCMEISPHCHVQNFTPATSLAPHRCRIKKCHPQDPTMLLRLIEDRSLKAFSKLSSQVAESLRHRIVLGIKLSKKPAGKRLIPQTVAESKDFLLN